MHRGVIGKEGHYGLCLFCISNVNIHNLYHLENCCNIKCFFWAFRQLTYVRCRRYVPGSAFAPASSATQVPPPGSGFAAFHSANLNYKHKKVFYSVTTLFKVGYAAPSTYSQASPSNAAASAEAI